MAKQLKTPSEGPKRDKDMGSEVRHLGGFRPGARMLATEVLILTARPPLQQGHKPLRQGRKPLITFSR